MHAVFKVMTNLADPYHPPPPHQIKLLKHSHWNRKCHCIYVSAFSDSWLYDQIEGRSGGSRFNIIPRYGDPHDKTVVRMSYLSHGHAYTCKTTLLYCDSDLVTFRVRVMNVMCNDILAIPPAFTVTLATIRRVTYE